MPDNKNMEGRTIHLSTPEIGEDQSLIGSIYHRRSVRSFADIPLDSRQVSYLLWACCGPTMRSKKAIPSAGGLYPLFFMVLLGIPPADFPSPGLYDYHPEEHSVTLALTEDLRWELAEASLRQGFIVEAPMTIIIGATPSVTLARYGERGWRYIMMETGHAGQNISLMAASLGLGSVMVGAFDDQKVSRCLKVPPDRMVLYLIPIGHERDISKNLLTT